MAKLLKKGGNVLLLDEPTNDLDVETLRALEEGLLAFPGCAMWYLTIAGFSTGSAHTFWLLRVTVKLSGMKATTPITKPTIRNALATPNRPGSSTRSWTPSHKPSSFRICAI